MLLKPQIDQKKLVQKYAGFVNFRSMIKLLMRLPGRGAWPFIIFEGKTFTYREVYDRSREYADFFLARRKELVEKGRLTKDQPLPLAIYQDNTPEYLFASFGAGLANATLFAVNTGFRGETLAGVINQAGVFHILTNADALPRLEASLPDIKGIQKEDVFLLEEKTGAASYTPMGKAIDALSSTDRRAARKYAPSMNNTGPVLVIYTSGTTGLPKGVPCTHLKMIGAGAVVQSAVHLKPSDRGYICMPLFHSNAWYVGVLPIMIAGASFVLKRKFSASAFETDILTHGVTYMNYVGQPLHYILSALEARYGSGQAVKAALAGHPDNRFRIAYGNGAPAIDREKMKRYLNMEHVFEIYGSTEAVITTANKPGDPIDSMGRVPGSVVILDEEGNECDPGEVDTNGRLLNYDRAVGEICKKTGQNNLRFDGYFDNESATTSKFRGGYYHSGDLGHIRIVNGKRYLFFNGRTDDWIRKDGENFSAENVVTWAATAPGVKLAIAHGAPAAVSDETVMVALEMLPGQTFDPQAAYDNFIRQEEKGMDPKWMPDYIRIIDGFTLTSTQKILVRPFKRQHFNIEANPDMTVYFRQRGDTTYRPLTPGAYQTLKQQFEETGRGHLLE
ncbi:MAG: AMP-binding protein [Thermodesulfobacteriota bacterium]|nr:AMP-binding protein [Thermodesulfobacteriota bacterium]